MKLPQRFATQKFRNRKHLCQQFHGRVNNKFFCGYAPRSVLVVVRQALWDEAYGGLLVQIEPIVAQRGWIGIAKDEGTNVEQTLLFPEADLNQMIDGADILDTVDP